MADVGSGESGTGVSSAPAAASPAVTPGTSASTVTAPTAQSQGDGSTVGSEPKGPIPFERHDEIVKGFHKKLDALKWAEKVDQSRYQQMSEWYDMADRNPVEFFNRFKAGLEKHPTWGKYLTPQQAQAQQQANPEPEPDLVAENGQPVYSAPQLRKWQEWNNAKTKAEFQSMVSPLLADRQQTQMQAQAQDFAKRTIEELSGLPGFDELKPEIAKNLKADRRLSPLGAYKRAYEEVYKPKMAQTSRDTLLNEMNQKAAANTANPNATAATPKSPRDMSWEEALEWASKKK
jgi:hypothetical protein